MNNFQVYEYCKRKREENYDWSNIVKFLIKDKKISSDTTVEDIKNLYRDIAAEIALGHKVNPDGSKYDEVFEQFQNFIGKTSDKFKQKKSLTKTNKDVILCISDLHVPYIEEQMLMDTINEWKNRANILVINGDFCNGDKLSTHAKFKHESFKEELAKARVWLELFNSIFDKVYLLDDNHVDARWKKFLGNDIPPDMHFLLEHPYDYITKGLNNVIRAKDTHTKFGEDIGHCLVLGDALFSHGFVSGKDGKSARKVQDWYGKWKDALELPPVRVFIHGHVHQLSLNFDYDRAVIQAGTFASMDGLKYSLEGHLASSPPCYGYSVITQYNGRTDFSETNIYKL